MAPDSVLARITDNPKLPSPPTLTLRVLEQASRPTCTISEIGKIISFDPALCGKMLKLVNSSLFGLQRAVTSIERALNLLGLNHVRSLVLSLSLPSLRFKHASSEQMNVYWKKSVTMAMVCRELAARRKWADPDSEMVAGLLCDLGILLLQDTFPEEYQRVADDENTADLCTLEELAYRHQPRGSRCPLPGAVALGGGVDRSDPLSSSARRSAGVIARTGPICCLSPAISRSCIKRRTRAELLGQIVIPGTRNSTACTMTSFSRSSIHSTTRSANSPPCSKSTSDRPIPSPICSPRPPRI